MNRPTFRPSVTRRALGCAVALALVALLGTRAAPAAPSSMDLAVIVNVDSPVQRLSRGELSAIFLGNMKEWPSGVAIRLVYARSEEAFRTEFERVVLKMAPHQVAQHWIDKRVRGQGTAPRELASADMIARVVAGTPGAIGYVPEGKVNPRTRVVARIRDGKVVAP